MAISRRRGLTLLELLLALAITACIGLAMGTVLTAAARGMTMATSGRSALQRVHAGCVRLRAYTDPAFCLLQHDPQRGFAIWLHDQKPGLKINLREVRAFWFNTDDGTLIVERVSFPEEWPEEMKDEFDVALLEGSDFLFEMETQRQLGYTIQEVLTDGMESFELGHDAVSIESARRFRLLFTPTGADDSGEPVLAVFAFQNHMEP